MVGGGETSIFGIYGYGLEWTVTICFVRFEE